MNPTDDQLPQRSATLWAAAGALLALLGVWHWGLHSYVLTDYRIEQLPAMQALHAGDPSAFLRRLPAYGGALLLEAPASVLGGLLGPDSATGAWRAVALPGLLALVVLGILCGRRVAAGGGSRPGLGAAATALLVAGGPVVVLAEQLGHPEEPLIVALMLAAVLAAMAERAVLAGVLVGLAAAGKPWALIAVPVVLVGLTGRAPLLRALLAMALSATLLLLPGFVAHGRQGPSTVTASATATGVFRPTNVFWFAGRPNPRWDAVRHARTHALRETDPALALWAQRLAPSWAGRISHPLVVLAALALALAFRRARAPGERRGRDLLLLLAAVCWWRCLLDTWNVHYYALGAVTALATWEAWGRRVPLLSAAVTVLVLVSFRPWSDTPLVPDVQSAAYVAWALPFGVWLAARALWPGFGAAWLARARDGAERAAPTLVALVAPQPVRRCRRRGPVPAAAVAALARSQEIVGPGPLLRSRRQARPGEAGRLPPAGPR